MSRNCHSHNLSADPIQLQLAERGHITRESRETRGHDLKNKTPAGGETAGNTSWWSVKTTTPSNNTASRSALTRIKTCLCLILHFWYFITLFISRIIYTPDWKYLLSPCGNKTYNVIYVVQTRSVGIQATGDVRAFVFLSSSLKLQFSIHMLTLLSMPRLIILKLSKIREELNLQTQSSKSSYFKVEKCSINGSSYCQYFCRWTFSLLTNHFSLYEGEAAQVWW